MSHSKFNHVLPDVCFNLNDDSEDEHDEEMRLRKSMKRSREIIDDDDLIPGLRRNKEAYGSPPQVKVKKRRGKRGFYDEDSKKWIQENYPRKSKWWRYCVKRTNLPQKD